MGRGFLFVPAARMAMKPSRSAFLSWIYDPKIRGIIAQVVTLIVLGLLVGWLAHNAIVNLAARGIASGFDFLNDPAGFGILQTLIPYTESDTYARVFVIGLLNTLLVSALGIVAATILGFIMGVARLSKNALVSALATVYIETFRNIPPLLQIFFWYFAVLQAMPSPRQSLGWFDAVFLNIRGLYLPRPIPTEAVTAFVVAVVLAFVLWWVIARWAKRRQDETGQPFPVFWTGLGLVVLQPYLASLIFGSPFTWEVPRLRGFNFVGGWVMIPELVALWVALSIYTSAFIAEIVRAGILAVPHGQTEAAMALGLTSQQRLRLVILPQAMRVIIPPLTSQYLNLTKNSSLAAAIGYPDIVGLFAGTVLNQTGQAIETIAMAMAVYLTISIMISLFMNWYNKRMALVER